MARATTPVAVLYPQGRRAGTESDESHVGAYELIGEIGRGGMGTVYLAGRDGHAGFRRLSALKLMHQHLADDLDFLSMFLDEARIAARIHHANVVSILDLDSSSRGYFVVMDYVEGCSLAQLLSRSSSHRTPRVLSRVVVDFLLGLHAAHSLRDERDRPIELVHRDVSPANVLIGVDGVARITDFGVAKARARIATTQPGIHKGTLSYASPEQLSSPRLVDARTDVWAAGVLLWNSLTGRSLFRGDSDAQTVHRIIHRQVPPPSRIGLKPPPYFDEICLRALERDPQKRFSSAEEMADVLQEAALRQGVLGTQRELGGCVAESFALEFAARRKAIRDAERRLGARDSGHVVPELRELATPPSNEGMAELVAECEPLPEAEAGGLPPAYEELQFEYESESEPRSGGEGAAAEPESRSRSFGRALRLSLAAALVIGALGGAAGYASWKLGLGERAPADIARVSAREPAPARELRPAIAPAAAPPAARAAGATRSAPTRQLSSSSRKPAPERSTSRVRPSQPRSTSGAPSRSDRRQPEADAFRELIAGALRAQKSGRLDEALALVDRAIGVRRASRAYQVRADILMAEGATAAALEAANTAVALAPESARAWLTKGMLHYELRQYADAKSALERNLRIAPTSRDAETIRLIVEEL